MLLLANMKKISKNIKDTQEIAKKFLNELKPNKTGATVVGLYGDLGAGKTTFAQSIGKILEIKRKVNSPTFMIMKKYMLKKQAFYENFLADKTKPVSVGKNLHKMPAFKFLFHLDAYRLKNERELLHLGWDEIISNNEHLVFIEWPENIIKAMPKKHHQIHISHEKGGNRKFEIKSV
jgi:tRNA threonylcarbamoyladenosine biosynthesis protein TsaE